MLLSSISIRSAATRMNFIRNLMSGRKSVATTTAAAEPAAAQATYPDLDWVPDCAVCNAPCDKHKAMPDYLKIDMEDQLLGSMKPYKRHVIYSEPRFNAWKAKMDEEKGSMMEALAKGAKAAGKALGYRVVVTSVDLEELHKDASAPPFLSDGEVMILPERVALRIKSVEDAEAAIQQYLTTGSGEVRKLSDWKAKGDGQGEASGIPYQAAWILVCCHKLRDKRCGVAGPLIMEELRLAAKEKGIGQDVAVLACSHVGGHKFAGNILVYDSIGGHWYGRVKPCHAPVIIEEHVVKGRVLKDLWRGRMDV
jgi:(2Fe-2S) ferredoxin